MGSHARQNCMEIQRCGSCTTLLGPNAVRCSSCRGVNLEAASCSGTGSIVSWKIVEPVEVGLRVEAPVTLAIVELDDGPWLYSKIQGSCPDDLDARMRVEFQAPPSGDGFPIFGVCAA